jgi:putative membrane protein
MRNIWSIFKQDLLNLKRVPLVAILLIGLAILPATYAWFNLGAAWDPYGNTKGIQVALVNEDHGTEINGEYINIGEELVENLANNENLGWTFVSRDEAEKGVKHGDYYSGIYIHHNFTEDLVQVLSNEPVQAEIFYQVNEKINAIAPKMTSAGASTIVKEINDQFVEEASKALFQEFDRIGIKIEEELPTLRKLKQVIYDLEHRFPEVNEFANWLIEIDENWYKIESHADRIIAMEEHIPQINLIAEQILELEKQFPQIYKFTDEILLLEEKIPEIKKVEDEMEHITLQFSKINDNLQEALEGTKNAQTTIRSAKESLLALQSKGKTVQEYGNAFTTFFEDAQATANPVIDTLAQQVLFISQTTSAIDQSLAMLDNEQTQAHAKESLNRVNKELSSHIRVLENGLNMYIILYETSKGEGLLPVIDQLSRIKEMLETLQKKVVVITQLEEGNNLGQDQVGSMREKTKIVEKRSNELHTFIKSEGAESIEKAIEATHSQLNQADGAFEKAYSQLESMEAVLIHAETITVTGEENIKELIERLPEIEVRINEITDKIQKDLPAVIELIKTLSEFIKNDLPVIEEQLNQVTVFIREDLPKIESNYLKLTKIMEESLPDVQQSINELAEFSREHLPEVEANIKAAAERIKVIEDDEWISDLISILRNDLDEESEFFANPVTLIEEELFPIPNYGSANVPFYTTLSLWVGALLLSNLISTNLHSGDRVESYTLRQIYFGRMILFLIVGILQGIIVSVGNLTLLGIYAAHPFLLVLFSIIIAVVFMTIVYTLTSILGNIGKALAIVLLVLQLSSGGGTFPIEVAPPFYQVVHPFMPFAYAINLLREAVGGIIPALVWKNLCVLASFWLLAVTIGFLLKPILAGRIEKTVQKSKSSRLIE